MSANTRGHGNTSTHRLDWFDLGSCTTADPDLFFPEAGADASYPKSICRGCPVRKQCLDYALATGQKHGIWGGMTENQRRRLRRHDPVEQPAERPAAPVVRHLTLVR